MQDVNLWTMIGTILLTGAVTYTIARLGKNADARGQAEAALMGVGPDIIKEQNERIARQNDRLDKLSTDIDILWTRERECRAELMTARGEIGTIDRRYQWFVSALLQNIVILRRMLRQGGTQLPAMVSLERFEEDGGTLREEWIRAIQDE